MCIIKNMSSTRWCARADVFTRIRYRSGEVAQLYDSLAETLNDPRADNMFGKIELEATKNLYVPRVQTVEKEDVRKVIARRFIQQCCVC